MLPANLSLKLVLCVSGMAACMQAAEEYQPVIKGVTVNGEKVPASEIKKAYDAIVAVYLKPGKKLTNELYDKLASKAREQAVHRTAVRQYLTKNNINITPEDLKKSIEAFKLELKDEGNNFETVLKAVGKTEEEFASEFKARAALSHSVEQEINKEESLLELKKKFDEGKDKLALRRISHVQFSFTGCKFARHSERTKEDAQKLAEVTLERAKKGAEIADLALELSDDGKNSEKGGDMGWIKPGDMPQPFIDAAYALKKEGELGGEIVESEYGFHVIKCIGVRKEIDAFEKFRKMAIKKKTIEIENQIVKEAKVEEEAAPTK